MHSQDFSSPWPTVLQDMHEFVSLTHLSLGRGRSGQVLVHLSKQRVAATELQPHVNNFRAALAAQLPRLRLELSAADSPIHRVEVHYGK